VTASSMKWSTRGGAVEHSPCKRAVVSSIPTRGLHSGTAISVFDEVIHPVRKPPALQFAVHQRAWRTGEYAAEGL
jgi:hypothetical protein